MYVLCVRVCVCVNTNFPPIDTEKLNDTNINSHSFIKERGWEKLSYHGLSLGTWDSIPKVSYENSFSRTLWHEREWPWGQGLVTVEKCKYKACKKLGGQTLKL